jgi:O-antigen ligase
MNKIEKLTIAALLIAIGCAMTLFGVWEDKIWLLAPVQTLVYLAAAVWAVCGLRRRQRSAVKRQKSDSAELTSDLRSPTSGISLPPGGVPLLLFWLYSFALIPFSVLPYEAKISSLGFGSYVAIYWISANLLTRFSLRKTVWLTVFAVLVFTALYSLVQHRVAPDLIFGAERYTTYWKGGRLGGTYQCPNHIAHLFQLWLPLCLVFLFIPQFGWFWRICFAYALPLFALLIFQTQSRAGILGAVAAPGVTVLLMVLRKSRRAFYIALLVVPLLGAVAIGALWAGSSMFRTRMQPVVKFFEHHMNEDMVADEFKDFRPQTWLDTITMIKDRPVFGVGPGNYGLTYEDYRTRFAGVRIETVHAHNEYLELLAEHGAVGGVLALWVLISVSAQMIRFIRTSPRPYHVLPAVALLGALAGTAVHGFFDFELHIFPNAMMLALLAGCAAAPMLQLRRDKLMNDPGKHENTRRGKAENKEIFTNE